MTEKSIQFFTYVIYSQDHDKIYVGFTSDLDNRLKAHNHPKNKGYTKRFQPWVVVHFEAFDQKSDAIKREKELKSFQGRQWIKMNILKQDP